jgi:hypothetical protein
VKIMLSLFKIYNGYDKVYLFDKPKVSMTRDANTCKSITIQKWNKVLYMALEIFNKLNNFFFFYFIYFIYFFYLRREYSVI